MVRRLKRLTERRVGILEMTDSVWVKLFVPWPTWAACTRGLPPDAKVLGVMHDELRRVWRVGVESSKFDPVPEGCEPPVLLAVEFSSHTCDAPGPKELTEGK